MIHLKKFLNPWASEVVFHEISEKEEKKRDLKRFESLEGLINQSADRIFFTSIRVKIYPVLFKNQTALLDFRFFAESLEVPLLP